MKTLITIALILCSIGSIAQSPDSLFKFSGKFTAESLSKLSGNNYAASSESIFSYPVRRFPDTVKAGLMIANKQFRGRPRICIGTVIIQANYTNSFFDHRNRPVNRKRILWAQEIKPTMSY